MDFLKKLTTLEPGLINKTETSIQIENAPFMKLCIENIGLGPRGLPALSICHYGMQNGDLMRDPEMCFEMEILNGTVVALHPYYFRNDYAGVEEIGVEEGGAINDRMVAAQRYFAQMWSQNLFEQGFLSAYEKQRPGRLFLNA